MSSLPRLSDTLLNYLTYVPIALFLAAVRTAIAATLAIHLCRYNGEKESHSPHLTIHQENRGRLNYKVSNLLVYVGGIDCC